MRIVYFSLLLLTFGACNNGDNDKRTVLDAPRGSKLNSSTESATDSTKFTTIQWSTTSQNYGKIEEGEKLNVSFHFKNTGDKPLVIERVQASCGCTAAEPPKEPVAPGKEGDITAVFNSEGKSGSQHKSLYVHANTKGTQDHELLFEVEVEKKKS